MPLTPAEKRQRRAESKASRDAEDAARGVVRQPAHRPPAHHVWDEQAGEWVQSTSAPEAITRGIAPTAVPSRTACRWKGSLSRQVQAPTSQRMLRRSRKRCSWIRCSTSLQWLLRQTFNSTLQRRGLSQSHSKWRLFSTSLAARFCHVREGQLCQPRMWPQMRQLQTHTPAVM